jgi:hypothetical protein
MRSYQVFAAMSPERASALLRDLARQSPAMFRQSVDAAALAARTRPVYLRNQPFEKRAEAVRRTLSRVVATALADELLAIYFLECRGPVLAEWLDALGLAHENGVLEHDAPAQPPEAQLRKIAAQFLAKEDDPDRELLLRAFAAQPAVEWPALDTLLEERSAEAAPKR